MLKDEIGKRGEQLASDFLKRHGYKIITHNFRTRSGEIDIIGYESETICFIEVKTRSGLEFGEPEESITPSKRNQLIKTALYYLKRHKIPETIPVRFDVISVMIPIGHLTTPKITLFKNAFSLCGDLL